MVAVRHFLKSISLLVRLIFFAFYMVFKPIMVRIPYFFIAFMKHLDLITIGY